MRPPIFSLWAKHPSKHRDRKLHWASSLHYGLWELWNLQPINGTSVYRLSKLCSSLTLLRITESYDRLAADCPLSHWHTSSNLSQFVELQYLDLLTESDLTNGHCGFLAPGIFQGAQTIRNLAWVWDISAKRKLRKSDPNHSDAGYPRPVA